MKLLLLYATVEGQTAKIMGHVKTKLQKMGHECKLIDTLHAQNEADSADFDAVIAAAPVHVGAFPAPLRRYLRQNSKELMSRPGAFISVSLSAASDDPYEVTEIADLVTNLSEETGWWPIEVHHAAGALKFTSYDFFKKWMLKRIATQEGAIVNSNEDYEFTDWQALDEFLDEFVSDAPQVAGKV